MKEITLMGFGYLGFQVYRKLKKDNYRIRIVSPPKTWYHSLLTEEDDSVILSPQTMDCKSEYYQVLSNSIKKNSIIIYSMGSINATTPPFEELETELNGYYQDFYHTIKIANSANCSNFIFFSSGGTIYGETTKDFISESDSPNPVNIYGLQKLAFEQMLKINRKEGGCLI